MFGFFILKHSNKSIMKKEKLRIKKKDNLVQTHIVSKN